MIAGLVTIDGTHRYLATYDPAVRWNGWLCPFFTRDVVDKIIADLFAGWSEAEDYYVFRWEGGTLVVTSKDGDHHDDERLDPVDGRYALGGWSWTWTEAAPEDALDADLCEALGLDPTGRDGHEHFPYRWSDPWVQTTITNTLRKD